MNRRRFYLLLLAIAVLALCSVVLADWIPLLRGPVTIPGEWSWPYDLRPVQRWWLPASAALVTLAAASWWLVGSTTSKGRTWVALLLLLVSALLLQLSLVYADRPQVLAELVDRTLADQTSGYYRAAAETGDLGQLLANYPDAMPGFESEHLRTHPPGLLALNWLLIRALDGLEGLSEALANEVVPLRCTDLWLLNQPQSTIAGLGLTILMPIILAILVVPMSYLLSKRIMDEGPARLAAALVATMPALLLFVPLADQVLAFVCLAAMLTLIVAIDKGLTGLFYLTGLIMAVATFLSFGSLAILGIGGLVLIGFFWSQGNREPDHSIWIRWVAGLLLGFVTPWLLYWAFFSVAPWQIAKVAVDQHYQLVTSQRDYGLWLGFNLVDLILFTGLPVIAGFSLSILTGVKEVKERRLTMAGALALAVAITLLLLLLSGSTRGEVGRIWLFLMPLVTISAAFSYSSWLPDRRSAGLLVALQLLMVLAMGLAWRPVEAVIVVAQRPEMGEIPADIVPMNMEFEEGITLAGYRLETETLVPGHTVDLTLVWRSEGATRRPYTVFTHVVDANGKLVAQEDLWPGQGQWPPTCWSEGEEIIDTLAIQLPQELPAGDYQILIGLYDGADGQRLLTVEGNDSLLLKRISTSNAP